jgi:hypothetical protein
VVVGAEGVGSITDIVRVGAGFSGVGIGFGVDDGAVIVVVGIGIGGGSGGREGGTAVVVGAEPVMAVCHSHVITWYGCVESHHGPR